MSLKQGLAIVIGVMCIANHAVASDEQRHERWIHGYVGKDVKATFPTSERGVEAMYEFENQIFLTGSYHGSKELSGGTDNNGLYIYHTFLGAGYTFNVTDSTKLQLGYQYWDANIKNVEMDGVRVGTYRDQHIYGDGPMLRGVQQVLPNLNVDLSWYRLKSNIDENYTYSQLGFSYQFTPLIFGRIAFLYSDDGDAGWNLWRKSIGVGYRF